MVSADALRRKLEPGDVHRGGRIDPFETLGGDEAALAEAVSAFDAGYHRESADHEALRAARARDHDLVADIYPELASCDTTQGDLVVRLRKSADEDVG